MLPSAAGASAAAAAAAAAPAGAAEAIEELECCLLGAVVAIEEPLGQTKKRRGGGGVAQPAHVPYRSTQQWPSGAGFDRMNASQNESKLHGAAEMEGGSAALARVSNAWM